MDLFQTVLNNLASVGSIFGVFALIVIANIIISSYRNVQKLGQTWDWKKFGRGVAKMLCIGLSSAILSVVVTLALPFLSPAVIQPEALEGVSNAAILAVYALGIVYYFKEAMTKITEIVTKKDLVKELMEDNTPEQAK